MVEIILILRLISNNGIKLRKMLFLVSLNKKYKKKRKS